MTEYLTSVCEVSIMSKRCRYCENKTTSWDMCTNCSVKLKLVRELLSMVRQKARELGRKI